MGAPGEYVLCGYGHVIGMIEDDLYWGASDDENSVYKKSKRLENSRCIKCGRIAKYRFCHYGDINDCLDDEHKLQWNSKENRYIIPYKVKPNLNLNLKPSFAFHNDIAESIIEKFRKAGIKFVHRSQIGKVEIPEVSDDYLINLIMSM